MKRILVTGTADFIGSAVVRYLINDTKHQVPNLGKLTYAGNVEALALVDSITGDKALAVKPGHIVVRVDPRYFRPIGVETLPGDPVKANALLGCSLKITSREMCAEMVREDLESVDRDELTKHHSYKIKNDHE